MKFRLFIASAFVCAGCAGQPAADAQATRSTTVSITSKSPDAIARLQKGETLLDNLRTDEATKEFEAALQLDPDFVLARAYLGLSLPNREGLDELAKAAAAAASLPESERAFVQGLDAERRGDFTAATAAYKRVTELAPDDWHGHYALGRQLLTEQRYADAVQALANATAMNPNAGGAQNLLGYAALRQRDAEGAIAAFTQYARILPQEPNAQDSLGEGLLAAGRFPEAETAFRKALELSPQFWNAHEGIAYTKFYAGDWAGGREALAQAQSAATRVGDKIGVAGEMAAAASAQRNVAEALQILDAAAKTEGAKPADTAFIPVRRAAVLIETGRPKEAMQLLVSALDASGKGDLPPGLSRDLRREALRAKVSAEARLGAAAAAEQTSAMLDQDAQTRTDDPAAQSAMHYGRGELAMARKQAADAQTHFKACAPEDDMARWRGMMAAEMAGDKTAATAARETLLKIYVRDPLHLIIRSRLAAAPKTT